MLKLALCYLYCTAVTGLPLICVLGNELFACTSVSCMHMNVLGTYPDYSEKGSNVKCVVLGIDIGYSLISWIKKIK